MFAREMLSVLLLASVACGDSAAAGNEAPAASAGQPAAAAPAVPAAATPAAPASGGAITGTITYTGAPDEPVTVDTSVDDKCHKQHADGLALRTINVGAGGGLMDVFVQITNAPDAKYETPTTPVQIDQRGCVYIPHVLGAMKKQEIEIINSDPTLHNIHAMPKTQKEFNIGMPDQGMRQKEAFKKAEDAITIKCDVHPWMKAYTFVLEHPFFAVSGTDGKFTLPTAGLADGEYDIKLWHETLGEKTGKVTVKDGAGTFDHAFSR